MNKNWLQNPLAVAGMILLINIIASIIILGIAGLLGSNGSSLSTVAALIAAIAVGALYSKEYHEAMPKDLRVKSILWFIAAQVLIIAVTFSEELLTVLAALDAGTFSFLLIGLAIFLLFAGFQGAVMYWLMGSARKK